MRVIRERIIWLSLFILGILVLIYCIRFKKPVVEYHRDILVVQRLADTSELLWNQHPERSELSTLISLELLKHNPSYETDHLVRAYTALLREIVDIVPDDGAVAGADSGVFASTCATDFDANQPPRPYATSRITFTADGTKLAIASFNGILRVFEIASTHGHPQLVLKANLGAGILAMALRPNSKQIALGLSNNRVRLLDLETHRELMCLPSSEAVQAVAFDGDGNFLGIAGDKMLRIVDLKTGKDLPSLPHEANLKHFAISPNAKFVATNSDRIVRVINQKTRTVVRQLVHSSTVNAVAFSPDSQLLATGDADGVAHIFDLKDTCAEIAHLQHQGAVADVKFTKQGDALLTASGDQAARLWDFRSKKEIARLVHPGPVSAIVMAEGEDFIATAANDGTRIFKMQSITQTQRLNGQAKAEEAMFVRDQREIAIDEGKSVSLFDVQSSTKRPIFQADSQLVAFAASPNGETFAGASSNGTLTINHVGRTITVTNGINPQLISAIASSSDGRLLAVAISEQTGEPSDPTHGSIRQVDVITGKSVEVLNYRGHTNAIAISSDARLLGIGTTGSGAFVFNLLTGERRYLSLLTGDKRYLPYSTAITAVSFSPSSTLLAISDENGFVQVFDANTGAEASPFLNTGRRQIKSIMFSDDGKMLAVQDPDGSIDIFDLASGAEIVWIVDPGLKSLMFDKNDILTVSFQFNSIHIHRHPLDAKNLAHQACLLLSSKKIESGIWESYFSPEGPHDLCR